MDLQASLRTLQIAYEAEPYPTWSQRHTWLKNLSEAVFENKIQITEAISADFGYRSPNDTLLAEIFPVLEGIRHTLRHGKSWMKTRKVPTGIWFKPATSELMPQPLGVVGVMVPFNYPLLLSLGPLTNSIAAGNRTFIKMSEYSPKLTALLKDILSQSLGDDIVQIVDGEADLAATFSCLPFNHLIFTGSTAVGKLVMKSASENLVPVTLELGGKSPSIISPETAANPNRLRNAVSRIIAGKSLNAGQTCIAPDYVLIPKGTEEAFLAHVHDIVTTRFPNGAASKDFSGIVSDRHYDRLIRLMEEAKDKGARVETVMKEGGQEDRKFPLTFVFDLDEETKIMQEEIFGPIMPVIAYETLDEAINHVRARPRPLALYLFDDNKATQKHVLENTVAGGVCINDTLLHIAQDSLPFGGVGDSGMGHYHGIYGFQTLSKLKPIFRQARYNSMEILSPPYGKLFKFMTDILTRKVR